MPPANALIVDDESHARVYARLLLGEVGIQQCWEAADGEKALELFAREKPQLVLLDINLRMTTGLQVLQQMKAADPQVPIIILSSESAMKTVYEAERLGALAYLLKYDTKAEALATLREALGLPDAGPALPASPAGR
jgi:two-component system chemotaxis response regulator CheY